MKLLKNIVCLLVLTSLSLSITPLTTAKAATAAKAIQVNTREATSASLSPTYSALSSSDVATPTSTAADTTTTADTATSDVSVTVLSGILTLEAVPNFNFGSMMQGTTAKLKNNTVDTTGYNSDDNTKPITAGKDGNDSGLLEVIDSRNTSDKMPGFTLSASMGPLKTIDSDSTADLNAILHLSAIPLLDSDKNNVSTTSNDLTTETASIDSEKGNTANVMNLEAGSYNAGIISANFNTPDSASLNIPGSGNNTEKSAKNMNAVITWTLTAKPTVTTATK